MDDPVFLAGRSTYAKKRRAKRLGICRCGAIMHNILGCNKQAISLAKSDRLDFVKYGRVILEDETRTNSAIVRRVALEYGLDIDYKVADVPRHPSRSPEETPEFYQW
nr:MAG: RNA-binding protein [Grapevine virus M]